MGTSNAKTLLGSKIKGAFRLFIPSNSGVELTLKKDRTVLQSKRVSPINLPTKGNSKTIL